jgi:photosystem I subunit 11
MTIDVIQHGGDPQVGDLATPVNASSFTKAFINNLPAYRQGLSANRRGLEIGMAHGYFLYGPFALLGPLRGAESGSVAGLLATVAVICLLTVGLSLYGGTGVAKQSPSVTTPNPPSDMSSREGWSDFASSFLLGGGGGALVAFGLCQLPSILPLSQVAGIWS